MTASSSPRTEADYVDRSGPETLRLRSVAPVFTVDDLAASLAFYRDTLGWYVAQEWGEEMDSPGAMLKAGSVDLVIIQDDFQKGKGRNKGVGMRLNCETAQDVDTMADAIKARGGTLDQEPTTHPWGARDFSVTDPDGFKLSIGSWTR